jgi:Ca2+/H+ antiporter
MLFVVDLYIAGLGTDLFSHAAHCWQLQNDAVLLQHAQSFHAASDQHLPWNQTQKSLGFLSYSLVLTRVLPHSAVCISTVPTKSVRV